MQADRTHASKQDTYRQMGTIVANKTYVGRQHTCRTGIRGRSAIHITSRTQLYANRTYREVGHALKQDIQSGRTLSYRTQ